MKRLIEDCLEFLLRTAGGVFILVILTLLILLAVFWPQAEREPLPWLGIVVQDIDSNLHRQQRLPFNEGVVVERVFNNSPADHSNLSPGDFILKFNNRIVLGEAQLRDLIFDLDPEEKAWMTVYRDGSYYNVMFRLAERPMEYSLPAQAAAFLPVGAGRGPQMAQAAPPITTDAILAHPYRGVCSNCHVIAGRRQAAQPNIQLVAALGQQRNMNSFFQGAPSPGARSVPAATGFLGNFAAQAPPPPQNVQQFSNRNLPGAVPLTPLEEFTWAGISVETLDPANAPSLGLAPNVTGVQVDEVLRGSRSDRAGVLQRDVIRELNGMAVYDVDSFAKLVTGQRLAGGVLLINRRGKSMYLTVPEV